MICVDTSIWIAAFRSATGPEAIHLQEILDADLAALPVPVRIELLSGSSRSDRPRLRRTLSALPLLLPGTTAWERIESWAESASAAGESFGVGDLLIAEIARTHDAELWTRDEDFRRMAHLGFVSLHVAK